MDGEGGYVLDVPFSPLNYRLLVDYSPIRHARATHPDDSVESSIESLWEARLAKNPTLFNASKFRYAGVSIDSHALTVTFHLGLTDYKTFQGTHGAPNALATFGRAGLALPMGNAVAVETNDGFVPFLVRCGSVGEGAGRAVMPGGHAEPSEVDIHGADGTREASANLNDVIAKELWNSSRREVTEELFVSDSCIKDMRFLGIVSRDVDAKALVAFAAKLDMSAEEVRLAYRAGNKEQEESSRVIFRPVDQLQQICEMRSVDGASIMPDHVGALALAVNFFQWRHQR